MSSRPKTFFYLIFTILLTLGLSLSLNYLLAAWSNPTGVPTTCPSGSPGCDAPINQAANLQVKNGTLWIGGDNYTLNPGQFGLLVEKGNVGIGTTAPGIYKLYVNGPTYFADDITGTEGFSVDNDATDVYDDATTSNSPYSRVNADSLHTNGIGVGNMYIEGSAIDANSTINIGAGLAGGQSVRNVFFGGQVKIAGGSPGANKVLTSDAFGMATWQTPSAGAIYTAGTGISISGTVITNTGVITETDPTVFAWAKAADDSKYLNTTATTQYKLGALGVGGVLTTDSNAYFDGNVGIGTTDPRGRKLFVNGIVRATSYDVGFASGVTKNMVWYSIGADKQCYQLHIGFNGGLATNAILDAFTVNCKYCIGKNLYPGACF